MHPCFIAPKIKSRIQKGKKNKNSKMKFLPKRRSILRLSSQFSKINQICLFWQRWKEGLSAGSGRGHPVLQLLPPVAWIGCSPLTRTDRTISSPQMPKKRKRCKENEPLRSNFRFLLPQMMPG